ncbi:hypothetical protein BJX70DRAFT_179090 [Aspergillus crustosus]
MLWGNLINSVNRTGKATVSCQPLLPGRTVLEWKSCLQGWSLDSGQLHLVRCRTRPVPQDPLRHSVKPTVSLTKRPTVPWEITGLSRPFRVPQICHLFSLSIFIYFFSLHHFIFLVRLSHTFSGAFRSVSFIPYPPYSLVPPTLASLDQTSAIVRDHQPAGAHYCSAFDIALQRSM